MHHQPAFIAPTQHTDAASAWQQVQTLYAHSVAHLRQAMQDFVAGRDVPDVVAIGVAKGVNVGRPDIAGMARASRKNMRFNGFADKCEVSDDVE